MKNGMSIWWGLAGLLAVGLAWVPASRWGLPLSTVFFAAAIFPGRVLIPTREVDSRGAALSFLLIAATSWLLTTVLGDLGLSARIALTIWVVAGVVFSRRWSDPSAESPMAHPRVVTLLTMLLWGAVSLPLLLNPSLWLRPEARLFLPLLGTTAAGTLPPTNPFMAGFEGNLPWMYAAFLAPFRALTGAPAHLLLGVFQVVGMGLLVSEANRWVVRRGGGTWARILLPILLVGGLTAVGFRGFFDLADLTQGVFRDAPLLRAMTALAGEARVAGLYPAVWGASPLLWSLATVAAAGSTAAGPRFPGRWMILGLLLGSAMLLLPAVGITGAGMWLLLRATGEGRSSGSDDRRSQRLEAAGATALAALLALPYLLLLDHPFFTLPLTLPALAAADRWAPLAEALPLLLIAAAALATRRDRYGWGAALVGGALAAAFFPMSSGGSGPFLWMALLFAGVPAALGLERLARRGWGTPLALVAGLLFLVTPALMVSKALGDRSGEPRWTEEERDMFRRADLTVPPDAVLLTLPTNRATSEEQLLLCRPVYRGPTASLEVTGPPADSVVTRRTDWLNDFTAGRNAVSVLDRMAEEIAPHPLVFVISSEDAARHRNILEAIAVTTPRFRVVENTQTLKILAYEAPPVRPGTGDEGKPPEPRIIIRPDDTGGVRMDTLGVAPDPPGAVADSTDSDG